MPAYKKKITNLMDYHTFKDAIEEQPMHKQAFLNVLFFSGCRVSEALALTSDDISCQGETVFVQFFRLKGSKQTDPLPLPREALGWWICQKEGKLFSFSRTTAYRIVKRCFPELYPHYFRMNRFTNVAEKYGLATMISFSGLAPTSVSHYIAKVDIGKVGKALQKEIAT